MAACAETWIPVCPECRPAEPERHPEPPGPPASWSGVGPVPEAGRATEYQLSAAARPV